MKVYRAFTYKVKEKEEAAEFTPDHIALRDENNRETAKIPYEESPLLTHAGKAMQRKQAITEFLAEKGIKLLATHTWIDPKGMVLLSNNMKTSIKE